MPVESVRKTVEGRIRGRGGVSEQRARRLCKDLDVGGRKRLEDDMQDDEVDVRRRPWVRNVTRSRNGMQETDEIQITTTGCPTKSVKEDVDER